MNKLTLAKAAEQWIEAKRQEAKSKVRLEQAAEVLKEHFRKTGRQDYKGLIGYARSSRVQLDQTKVKAELGSRLPQFQRCVEFEMLSLLKQET